jgi:hypothetical protein
MIKLFHYSICAHSHFQHLGDSTETLKKLADGTHPFSKKLNSAKERAAHKLEYESSFIASKENVGLYLPCSLPSHFFENSFVKLRKKHFHFT